MSNPEFVFARRQLLFPVMRTDERPLAGAATVNYESRGVALVIGPAALALPVARRLAETLKVLVCSRDAPTGSELTSNPAIMVAAVAALSGHLGQFTAKVHAGEGKLLDLGKFSRNADGLFDLVLDLNDKPLIATDIGPLGYFAPGSSSVAIEAVVDEMATLVGKFRKQRFFSYDSALCTHASQNVSGCTRCLEACPAGAILSKGAVVEVNPYLCQGCSGCALVCPTGAIRHATPVPRLAPVVDGQSGTLCIHETEDQGGAASCADNSAPNSVSTLAVPAIASVGVTDWLQALASGYQQVVVCLPAAVPLRTRQHLTEQVALANSVLDAIGHPGKWVILQKSESTSSVTVVGAEKRSGMAVTLPPETLRRRAAVMASLEVLEKSATRPRATGTACALAAGSPFGSIYVNSRSCTLCMACVNLCPTGALNGSENSGRALEFVESRCVQCGICAAGCPEHAITLQPRLLTGAQSRAERRTLKQDSAHHCTQCGKAFISTALLTKGLEIMQATQRLDTRGIALMKMCSSCRSRAASE